MASVCSGSRPLHLFGRETPAAPWCVLENSMVWCRGGRDAPFPTILESTLKSVNSSTGSTKSYEPTLEEITQASILSPCFGFSLATFSSFRLIKTQHMRQNAGITSGHLIHLHCPVSLIFSFLLITGITDNDKATDTFKLKMGHLVFIY